MKFRDIIIKNFMYNLKDYSICFINNVFCITIFFLFNSIRLNPNFIDAFYKDEIAKTFLVLVLLVIILFSIFHMIHSNKTFLQSRLKEFGLYLTLGMRTKDIKKMIAIENLIISSCSLLVGIICGIVFSKLFLLLFSHVLDFDVIAYHLSLINLVHTFFGFLIVYMVTTFNTLRCIRKLEIVQIVKNNKVKQETKHNSIIVLVIGILLTVTPMYLLYKMNFRELESNYRLFYTGIILTSFIGIYIVISQSSYYIIHGAKRNEKLYLKKILSITEMSHKLNDNKKYIFSLTILCILIFIFTMTSYNSFINIKIENRENNPYDYAYVYNDHINNEFNKIYQSVLNEYDCQLVDSKKLEFITMPIAKFPVLYEPVFVNENDSKLLYGENIDVSSGKVVIIRNGAFDNFWYSEGFITLQENNEQLIIESDISKNIMNKTNRYYNRYIFILDNDDYNSYSSQLSDDRKGTFLYGDFQEESKIKVVSSKIENTLYDEFSEYKTEKTKKDTKWYKYPFYITNRVECYKNSMEENKFIIFITFFIAILFLISAGNILSFKIISEKDKVKQKYDKIKGVGITKKEIKTNISRSIKPLFLIPIISGIIYSYILIFVLMKHTGMVTFNNSLILENVKLVIAFIVLHYLFYKCTARNLYRYVTREI
ncbi:peptide ABC transporter Pep4E family, permease [Vallitalea longa]|uniref:Peptide ABC transporter Pep4E family, permease n=1 Tax=Vallitalea longa TaxID=2936439 RepID=A0A9W5YB92_9FIRM|nr:ABC transporter permease [Vallitalea longa]GKX30802.1 peptide ABC transporter Pep4E family, permease [Vallitalea longa]